MTAAREYDVVVVGGQVVGQQGVQPLTVAIDGERICDLLPADAPVAGARVIDAAGLVVLPGGVDPHTHIHWPFDGERTAETVTQATRAALLGGTTTIVDFAPCGRDEDVVAALERRLAEFEGESACDFSFHSILVSADRETLDRLPELVDRGITSFKLYTTFADRRVDDGELWELMAAIAAVGGVAALHAENDEIMQRALADLRRQGRTSLADFPESRPEIAEAEAIATALAMVEQLDSPLYLLHLTSPHGLELVRRAQAGGVRVVAETCPHYLALDEGVFGTPEAWRYVISPPIRGRSAPAALWSGIADGTISSIGSDHCAYAQRQKRAADGGFAEAPFGAPGIHERLTVLLDLGVRAGRLSYEQLARVCATEPARLLGLYPRKGAIRPGADADLVLVDPARRWRFDDATVPTGEYTLFDGMTGVGAPVATMLRGRVVARDGEIVEAESGGEFLRRAPRGRPAPVGQPR